MQCRGFRRLAAYAAVGGLMWRAAPAAAAEAPSNAVEEIVVTAQLHEQRAATVPFALTALSGSALDDQGVQDFEQLALHVPGLQVQGVSPAKPGLAIRGVASDSGESFDEPRVSVFQDGVAISRSRGADVELFDLQRVEVAKGPQSTLYGRAALIGGINLIQNKARPGVFEASGRAEAGDGGYWLGEAVLNAPLGQTSALRLAGRVRRRDGYVDNLLGGAGFNAVDTQAYRAALNLSPDDRLRIDVIGNYQRDRNAGIAFKSLLYEQTDPTTGRVLASQAASEGAALAAAPGFDGGRGLGLNRNVWGVTAIARWRIRPGVTLTSTSAYRRFRSLGLFDADGTSLPILTAAEDARGAQTSQELRLNLEAGPRLNGILGASAFHESGSERTPAEFDERMILARMGGALNGGGLIPGRPAADPAPAATFGQTAFLGRLLQGLAAGAGVDMPAPLAQAIAANLQPGHLDAATNTSDADGIDLFGDATFRATDRLELGVGGRYAAMRKTTGFGSQAGGRSILGGVLAALGQPSPTRRALLSALAVPGAAAIPTSALYPAPMFGLAFQPTLGVSTTRLEDEGFTWRLTARYALTPDVNFYANYGRGRRPAVLSAAAPAAPGGPPRFAIAPAETVDSVEAGLKASSADGRLHIDAAAYGYDYDNFQTRVQQGTLFVVSNAGRARSYGFEGQARYAVGPNLDLFGTYAFNHGRFTTGAWNGNHLRLSPDHSLSFGAAIRAPVFGGEVEARPSVAWRSKVFFADDNDRPDLQRPPQILIADVAQDEVQGAYGLVDVRLAYAARSRRWSAGAFVTNVMDQRYLKDAGGTGDAIGMPIFVAGEPRFVGVTLSIRE